MPLSRTLSFGLAVTGLFALGSVATRPAAAQDLTFTLSGVTLNDGAVATGFFDYNPTTNIVGDYDFTSTDGTSDGLTGAHYTPATPASPAYVPFGTNYVFSGSYLNPFHAFIFVVPSAITVPGTYALFPGTVVNPTQFGGSGEFASTARVVTAGSLIVTAAVPEASSVVSLGLLLALGAGGILVAAKRKKKSI